MVTTNDAGGCWPTWEQELLLKAALLPGEGAIVAWEKWKSGVDFEHLDPGSFRLLPLLYRNLHTLGVNHPLMKSFKGVYRHTWYKNQILFKDISALLHSFHEAGVKTLILKGTALVLLYYKDYGLRPMNDFDVLVRREQTPVAMSLLKELRWTPKPEYGGPHAQGFENAAGREFDFHWHVLHECCQANADDSFWDGAISTEIHDVPTYVMNPTDQLLHVCVHGARWNPMPPLRWVADAMMILQAAPDVDWNRLVAQARERHLTLPLRDTLKYLSDVLDAPVPTAILQSLQATPVSKVERLDYQSNTCPHDLRGPGLTLWVYYREYLQFASSAGVLHKLIGFPKFLQHLWGVDYLWQVPFSAAQGLVRRIIRVKSINSSSEQQTH